MAISHTKKALAYTMVGSRLCPLWWTGLMRLAEQLHAHASESYYGGELYEGAVADLAVSIVHAEIGRRLSNLSRYNMVLTDLLEIPPNGDDYNALVSMAEGSDYIAPHTEGR